MSRDEEQTVLDTIVRAISARPGVKRIILCGGMVDLPGYPRKGQGTLCRVKDPGV